MSGGSEEKSLPASDKKLREARGKGQLAGSRDFIMAAGSVAALGYVALRGGSLLVAARALMDDAANATSRPWQEAMPALLARAAWTVADFVLPLLGFITASVVAASFIGNQGMVFSTAPLTPKMERIDPFAGFGRILSMRNGVDAVKMIVKFIVVITTLVVMMRSGFRPLTELPSCGLGCVAPVVRSLFGPLAVAAALLFLILGGLDLGLQRFVFQREMRMTRTEQKRERKDSEGNPLIKNAHKQEQRAAMRSHVRTGIRQASIVIHGGNLALALRYAPPDVLVPVLVARAGGDAALVLLEEASGYNLPCINNPETAKHLAARMRIGGLLPKELFPSVIACMREARII